MHDETRGSETQEDAWVRVCRWCDALVHFGHGGLWVHRFLTDAKACGRAPMPVAKGWERDGDGTAVDSPAAEDCEAQTVME